MARTVDEKLKYHQEQSKRTPFMWGYNHGVKLYRGYPKADKAERKRILAEIDGENQNARNGKTASREFSRGVMCGVRDAANERKAKNGK